MHKSIVVLLAAVCLSGCMTGGPVIGPFSYMAANHNDKVMTKRAIMTSTAIPQEKKAELFKATAMGGDARAYAVGIGVDLMALTDGQYTSGEAFTSLIGAVSDLVLYFGIGKGAQSLTEKDNSASQGNMTINGNVSDSQIQNYQGNVTPSSNGQNKPYNSENSTP